MINERNAKEFCKDFIKIKNYKEAISDKNEIWCCHHIMEEVFTKEELIRAGWYYNRKPEELIFLPRSKHNSNPNLHIGVRKNTICSRGMLGKHHTEETKKRMSDSQKGSTKSKEHKEKISKSMKGHKVSEETKRKMAEKRKLFWEKRQLFSNQNN